MSGQINRPSTAESGVGVAAVTRKASFSSFPSRRVPSNPAIRAAYANGSPTASEATAPLSASSSTIPTHFNRDSVLSDHTGSTPSSNKISPRKSVASRSSQRLKSQYPADAAEKHVEYILVASFDIDRGSIMEHQYPAAISGDEGMLAELMLPDQAHARKEDWTIFFLHKDAGSAEESEDDHAPMPGSSDQRRGSRTGVADSQVHQDSQGQDEDGPPLIYVLNLVNTKHDSTVKRGAIVKAMAICTRHSFLHIYKPLLLLALEEYFKAPQLETLEVLYHAVNSMDLSLMPSLTGLERNILLASDNQTLFVEKFSQMIRQRVEQETGAEASGYSPTKASTSMSTSNASLTRYHLPRDSHEFETKVVYRSIPVPIKVPTAISPETVGDFSLIKLIQAFSIPHSTSPVPFALHPHLTTSGAGTHPIIVLLNALLTQKRIVFIGHNRPSGDVAEAVLAACALASGGILRGFTRHAFPYTDLTKVDDLLNVPGFIAGVTNPTFSNHPEWWDLLCDIPTGRMKISSRLETATLTEDVLAFQRRNPLFTPPPTPQSKQDSSDPIGDHAFMESILGAIQSRHGEAAIRIRFRDYIIRFTRMSAAFEEMVYGQSMLLPGVEQIGHDTSGLGVQGHGYVWIDEATKMKELGTNMWRIEGWRQTRSYFSYMQDSALIWQRNPIQHVDLAHQHDRLRNSKLSREESASIYLALNTLVRSYDEICQLLTVTPDSNAGLFYLGLGLFHSSAEVRLATMDLLERISYHEAGRHFWARLGQFAKLAFFRTKRMQQKPLPPLTPVQA